MYISIYLVIRVYVYICRSCDTIEKSLKLSHDLEIHVYVYIYISCMYISIDLVVQGGEDS